MPRMTSYLLECEINCTDDNCRVPSGGSSDTIIRREVLIAAINPKRYVIFLAHLCLFFNDAPHIHVLVKQTSSVRDDVRARWQKIRNAAHCHSRDKQFILPFIALLGWRGSSDARNVSGPAVVLGHTRNRRPCGRAAERSYLKMWILLFWCSVHFLPITGH